MRILIILLLLTGCSAKLNPEQLKAIDSNFAIVMKANNTLSARIEKLEKQQEVKK